MMKTITTEDVQRYVRIVGYLIVGSLTQRGIAVDGTWIELALSLVGGSLLVAWSVYGMRINAKIAELGKLAKIEDTPVAAVVTTNTPEGRALAREIPGPVVVAGSAQAAAIVVPPVH